MESFKPLIAKVAAGAELTRAEAFDAFEAMLSGDVTPCQAGQLARPIDTFVRTVVAAGIERDLAELRKTLGEQSSELGRKR